MLLGVPLCYNFYLFITQQQPTSHLARIRPSQHKERAVVEGARGAVPEWNGVECRKNINERLRLDTMYTRTKRFKKDKCLSRPSLLLSYNRFSQQLQRIGEHSLGAEIDIDIDLEWARG